MISETTQGIVITTLAIVGGVFVDADTAREITSLPVDGTTITGGGVGLAVMLVSKGLFKRIDTLIATFKAIANHWAEHNQRIANLHAIALQHHHAIPKEVATDSTTAPIELDTDIFK